jgi:hypothetical protein
MVQLSIDTTFFVITGRDYSKILIVLEHEISNFWYQCNSDFGIVICFRLKRWNAFLGNVDDQRIHEKEVPKVRTQIV